MRTWQAQDKGLIWKKFIAKIVRIGKRAHEQQPMVFQKSGFALYSRSGNLKTIASAQ